MQRKESVETLVNVKSILNIKTSIMKNKFTPLFSMMILTILLIGCSKEANEEASMDCAFTSELLTIQPICSFDPRVATTVQFPVNVLVNGTLPGHDNYLFSWSKDPDFKGTAISVNFNQLPLVATLTEKSTGCTAEVTLENNYWD